MWQAAWRDAVWKGKACGWRTSKASQRTFSLEDKSSLLRVKLKVDIAPFVRNLFAPISPPSQNPLPIPLLLIILLNLKPHLSSQKQELFKQTTLTATLESFFHAQKFEKSFFFLTLWGVGVIPFTNMQTEGTVGGGDKMIHLMLHNRGWIWTKAKLCFLDFMLLLTATCIFLTTFTPAETQLAIETDCMKGHFFWLIILEKADHEMKDDWSPTCCSGWRSCRGCGAAKNPTHPNYFRWSREADSY